MGNKRLVVLTGFLFLILLSLHVSHAQDSIEIVNAEAILAQIAQGQDVSYSNVKIAGSLILTGNVPTGTVKGALTITDSTFIDELIAGNVTFERAVDFSGTTFAGKATGFIYATFKSDASFNRSTFQNPVDFSSTDFQMDAQFDGTVFQKTANFERSHYGLRITFADATFSHFADFSGARFCVMETQQDGSAACAARDSDSTIPPRKVTVNFDNAHFSDTATFEGADFLNSTASPEAALLKPNRVSFLAAQFDRDASFDKARFYNVSFSRAHFQGNASFRLSQFDTVNFQRTTLKTIDLNGAVIAVEINLTQAEYTLLKTIDFDFSKLPRTESVDLRDMLQRLEENFRASNYLVLSQEAYYQRRQVERALEGDKLSLLSNPLGWLQSTFEYYVGDYVRLDIPLKVSGALIILSTIIYGILAKIKWITLVPVDETAHDTPSPSILIRLSTLKVPVRLDNSKFAFTLAHAPPLPAPPAHPPGKQPSTGDFVWLYSERLLRVVRFSLRVFNDSLGGNVEAVCRRRPMWVAVVCIAYLNRLLGIALAAGLSITLTNVVPAIRTLFG